MSLLSVMRWAENWPLLIIGAIGFAAAWFGRAAARKHGRSWPQVHLLGMAGSYIALLTGFYVDMAKICRCGGSFRISRSGCCRARSACRWPSMSSGGTR